MRAGKPGDRGWWAERSGLAGTVAVITGGASGLGAAIASDLAANGVRLAIIDIDAEAATAIGNSLAASGGDAIVSPGRDPGEQRRPRLRADAEPGPHRRRE